MAPFKNTYNSRNNSKPLNDKGKKIEEYTAKKEQSIKKFADSKSASIAVSSAFNGAVNIMNALIASGKLDEFKWETHEKIYNKYLQLFAQQQVDGTEVYKELVGEQTKETTNNNFEL